MRLLMLTVDWSPIEGGIATLCEGTARALAARGHEVRVLAPRRPSAARPERTLEGVHVERWPGYGLGALRWVPFAAAAARRVPAAEGVLAMNPAYGGAVAAAFRRHGGPPYVAWAYGYEVLKARATPLAPLYRHVFGRSNGAFAISRYTRDRLASLGVDPDRIRIVPPGVDAPSAEAEEPAALRARLGLGGRRVVLTVGRLIPRKGHLVLLDAMARVVESRPDVAWVVVGRGPCRDALERRADALGIADRVRFTGYLEPRALEALYRTSAVFALTPLASASDAEGFGIVYLEAGARAVPVVASRSGGVLDAVEDGMNGLLVEPAMPGETAAAIGMLLDDERRARKLGERGRARAAAQGWDLTAKAVEEALAGGPR